LGKPVYVFITDDAFPTDLPRVATIN
jgi:hypothetical protein